MIFFCHFPWWREEGRMKIVNRQRIPQTNYVMDTMGVTVYKFALGLFGLQIDLIGLLQRDDYCGLSIGCMFSTGCVFDRPSSPLSLSRAFSNRYVFEENAHCFSVHGRQKRIETSCTLQVCAFSW